MNEAHDSAQQVQPGTGVRSPQGQAQVDHVQLQVQQVQQVQPVPQQVRGPASGSAEVPQEVRDRINVWLFEHVALPAREACRTARNVVPQGKAKANAKPKAKSRNQRLADAEDYVYTAVRAGAKYHRRRNCRGRNHAEEIDRTGLAEAIQ